MWAPRFWARVRARARRLLPAPPALGKAFENCSSLLTWPAPPLAPHVLIETAMAGQRLAALVTVLYVQESVCEGTESLALVLPLLPGYWRCHVSNCWPATLPGPSRRATLASHRAPMVLTWVPRGAMKQERWPLKPWKVPRALQAVGLSVMGGLAKSVWGRNCGWGPDYWAGSPGGAWLHCQAHHLAQAYAVALPRRLAFRNVPGPHCAHSRRRG